MPAEERYETRKTLTKDKMAGKKGKAKKAMRKMRGKKGKEKETAMGHMMKMAGCR